MSRNGTCIPTNKKVGVLYPNDADGNAIREHLAPALAKAGFTIVDPGPYEDGTTDYSAQIAKFKAEKCEIFNTFPIPPDFAAFWRQAAQQGYTKMVKICQIAKTGLFPTASKRSARLGVNISQRRLLAQGVPLQVVADRRQRRRARRRLREEPPASNGRSSSARTMSLFDAGFEALKASGNPTDKAAVAKAIATLKTTTIAGKVDFTSGPVPNVATGPDHRHAMGEGDGGIEVQARLRRHRQRDRSERADRGEAAAVQRLSERRGPNVALAGADGALLDAGGLHKRFDALLVLDGVDFSVRADEAVGIVGPNGAGKTTLLSVLVGAHAPTAGTVRFRGQDVTAAADRRALPARPRAHAPDPAAVQRHDGVRERLRRRRHGGGLSRDAAYDARDRSR